MRVLLMDFIWVISGLVIGSAAGYIIGGYFLLAAIADYFGRTEL